MSALLGTFVRLQTMADGGVRLVLDLQCTLADVAALGLMPGVAFGIARITGASTITPTEPSYEPSLSRIEPNQKPGPLCIMACTFCDDPQFLEFLNAEMFRQAPLAQSDVKQVILHLCGIRSRKELDTNPDAAEVFHNGLRKPFLRWKGA